MGMKYHEAGGGPATGLASDFTKFLESGITGSFGGAGGTSQFAAANPMGQTMGMAGVFNDILSGGAGKLGGSLAELLQTQQTNDIAGLRSRFGVGGGTSFGTPAAYAESTYRAQAAPQIATAIGDMQMRALSQLLPIYANLASKGIAQREGAYQPSPWLQAAQLVGDVGGSMMQGYGAMKGVGDFANSQSPQMLSYTPQMPANYPLQFTPSSANPWLTNPVIPGMVI